MRPVTDVRMSARELWADGLTGNARRVAEALRSRGRSTRAELIAATGLSRPTVSATITELTRDGLIAEDTRTTGALGGRPAAVVRLTRRTGLSVGVDVGRRHVRIAVADLGHQVLTERAKRLPADAEEHPASVLDGVAALIRSALDDLTAGPDAAVGAGLGIPAPITIQGRIGSPNLLPAWADLAPAEELADRIGMPVWVDNDANLGALGEYLWGSGGGCAVLVYIKLATSIGTAGEIGHITLDARGPVCRCGNRGCVELTVGGRALLEHARRTHPEIGDLAGLVTKAEAGDPGCRRLLSDAGTSLGIALGGLVNLLNPERIVLGGDLGPAEFMIDALRRGLADTGMPAAVGAVQVVPAKLGDRAAALGGVALVLKATEHATSHFAAVP
jgi:predicted NBD/HSP70 family sugar kinase